MTTSTTFKVIQPDDQEADEKLKRHLLVYPKVSTGSESKRPPLMQLYQESGMLQDTATSIFAVPRTASGTLFIPVGHISLDVDNPDAEPLELGVPSDRVFWVKALYVSRALHSQGIGRAAMDEAEAMAVREPLLAKTLMLDTLQTEDQKWVVKEHLGHVPKVGHLQFHEYVEELPTTPRSPTRNGMQDGATA